MSRTALAIAATVTLVAAGAASAWAATPLSVRDSWRIGTSGTSFCSAQSLTSDKALTGMFDAGYAITCRDAALAVGKLYKLQGIRYRRSAHCRREGGPRELRAAASRNRGRHRQRRRHRLQAQGRECHLPRV